MALTLATAAFVDRSYGKYQCPHQCYRSFDGTCNDIWDPLVGAAGGFYTRGPEGAEYLNLAEGTPVDNRPIERVVSNKISRDDPSEADPLGHNLFSNIFGQFITHELDNNRFLNAESATNDLVLSVPESNDGFCFEPDSTGTIINECTTFNVLPLFTTKSSVGRTINGVFEIHNNATAWLDLNVVYGPNREWNRKIRTFQDGLLLTADYINLPVDPANLGPFIGSFQPITVSIFDAMPPLSVTDTLIDPLTAGADPTRLFTAGDERAGQNIGVASFHVLFLRNHNWWARRIKESFPDADDDFLFEEARRRNIAEFQSVVLYQYLPTEIGEFFFGSVVGPYEGYTPDQNFGTRVAFGAGAFRYGHSSFRGYAPLDHCGEPLLFGQPAGPNVQGFVLGGGIDDVDIFGMGTSFEDVFRGLIATGAAPNDVEISDLLRNIAFPAGPTQPAGVDIWAEDMHRGRLNGLPNYNTLRKAYYPYRDKANIYGQPGCPASIESQPLFLDPIECFEILVPYNQTLAQNLQSLYSKVNNIDGIVGLLAEPHHPGTSLGDTVGFIIALALKQARDSDRFWFENNDPRNWEGCCPFTCEEVRAFKETTMGDLLRRHFDFPDAPDNPFYVSRFYC